MPNSAGLYLGYDFVDLIIMGETKGVPRILKTARTFLYEDIPPDAPKDRTKALAVAVKKALDSIKIPVGSVNFSLPQEEVMIRHFRMPYLPESERSSGVKFEAQRYLPFKIEETISDFYITGESKQERSLDIFFAAVNKDAMNKSVSLLAETGAKANIIDIASIALLRLLSYCRKLKTDQTIVVVYVEKNIRGSVIIVKEKSVYLSREVNPSASKAVFFENILNNIKLSVDYYKRETKEVIVSEILLCGDGELSELKIYLKENIETVPLDIAEITAEIEGLNDLSRKQLIAIGLAMASLEKPRPKINLLGTAPKGASKADLKEYKPVIIEGAALFVILAMLQFLGGLGVSAERKKLDALKTRKAGILKNINPDTPQEQLLGKEGDLQRQVAFMRELVGENRLYVTKKLNALGGLLPDGAWVESFAFDDELGRERRFSVKGMIYSAEQNEGQKADKMLADMKASADFREGFEDVTLSSFTKTSVDGRDVMSFVIECNSKPLNSSGLME
jgi:Tfp pilus assembly PilM family ATPase